MSCRYGSVPFHNFWHCVDVAHTTFLMLNRVKRRTGITQLEMLALLTAAVCHDLEHPGMAPGSACACHTGSDKYGWLAGRPVRLGPPLPPLLGLQARPTSEGRCTAARAQQTDGQRPQPVPQRALTKLPIRPRACTGSVATSAASPDVGAAGPALALRAQRRRCRPPSSLGLPDGLAQRLTPAVPRAQA